MTIEEIKNELAKQEKALANPKLFALMADKIQAKIDKLKDELSKLESEAEKKVEKAEEKVEKAEKSGDKKEVSDAKKVLDKAKEAEKKVEKVVAKVEEVEKKHGGARPNAGRKAIQKMKRPKGQWGGKRPKAGRKASSNTKIIKPKGLAVKPIVLKRKKSTAVSKVDRKTPSKLKSVRAFGQTVQYSNDADFCRQLISAFKKRKSESKKDGKRRKTKPVFGVIVNSTKNAVSRALKNVDTKKIEKNPKEFLQKASRLEKSAIRFLEDFKSILGSDYKKSEITNEFGELEKAIKQFVDRVTKK